MSIQQTSQDNDSGNESNSDNEFEVILGEDNVVSMGKKKDVVPRVYDDRGEDVEIRFGHNSKLWLKGPKVDVKVSEIAMMKKFQKPFIFEGQEYFNMVAAMKGDPSILSTNQANIREFHELLGKDGGLDKCRTIIFSILHVNARAGRVLVSTGDRPLVYTSSICDKNCGMVLEHNWLVGDNTYGKLLEEIRSDLYDQIVKDNEEKRQRRNQKQRERKLAKAEEIKNAKRIKVDDDVVVDSPDSPDSPDSVK